MSCRICGSTDHVEERHQVLVYYQPSLHTLEEFEEIQRIEVETRGGHVRKILDSAPNVYLPPGYLEVWGEDYWAIVREVRD